MLSDQHSSTAGLKFREDWTRAIEKEDICIQVGHSVGSAIGFENPLDRPWGQCPAILSFCASGFDSKKLGSFKARQIQQAHLGWIQGLQGFEARRIQAEHPELAVFAMLTKRMVQRQALGQKGAVEQRDVVLRQEKLLQASMILAVSVSFRKG